MNARSILAAVMAAVVSIPAQADDRPADAKSGGQKNGQYDHPDHDIAAGYLLIHPVLPL